MKTAATTTKPSCQLIGVEASAGSGKTHALAKRYVSLLLNSQGKVDEIPLREILAITFTNKASCEMKARILEFLKKISLGKFLNEAEEEDISSSIGGDKKLVAQKAHRAIDYIIRNYNFFQVETIDSFINAILTGCSFRFALSSSFTIRDDAADYLAYSLDKIVDRAEAEKKVSDAFGNFLTQYMLLENKKGWLVKNDIFYLVRALFNVINTYGYAFAKYGITGSDLFLKKKKILGLIKKLAECVPEGTHKVFSESIKSFVDKHTESFDIDRLSNYFNRAEFPIKKKCRVPSNINKLWESVRGNIKELCELEAFSVFNCYIDIFDMTLDELKSAAGKDEVLFLEELNRQARLLLQTRSVSVEEIYYRLATRFEHYLIDEFQDTSMLQWRNLYPLVEEALASGGSLFYVGDKKQAIYRFRGGEASLFDAVSGQFRVAGVKREHLGKNYRSRKEIIDFNNEVFSGGNLRRFIRDKEKHEEKKDSVEFLLEDVDSIVNIFRDSRQVGVKENAHGYVKTESVDCEDQDERDAVIKSKLFALLAELTGRFPAEDIALLARENDEVELVTSWLLEAGIPVESDKTLNIRECSFIKELVCFLRFLNSPIDDLSFASFILGDIFSKATGVSQDTLRRFVFDLRDSRREGGSVYLYRKFQKSYPQVWANFIDELFKTVGFYPLYEFFITIAAKFGIMKNFPQYQGFFMRFLELIKEKEEDYPSVSSFLEYFDSAREDDLFVNVTASRAVKVLTIHKAKGLEFGVVIIPFLTMDVKVGSRQRSYVVCCNNEETQLIRLRKRYGKFSPILNDIYRAEYRRSFIDELNAIYVAFTRPKYELYVFVPKKSSGRYNIAGFLVPEAGTERGKRINYKDKELGTKASNIKDLPPSEYESWIHLLKDEFIEESQLKNRDKILRGKVTHFMLSFIGNLKGEDKDLLLREALERTRPQFPFISDFSKFEEMVKKLLEEETLKRFFYIDKGEVFQEKEIVNSLGHTKRIDRLIVKEKEVWVVDYKSSHDEKADYEGQVREYMDIIRNLYPHRVMKGFLLYLDDLSTEEVHG